MNKTKNRFNTSAAVFFAGLLSALSVGCGSAPQSNWNLGSNLTTPAPAAPYPYIGSTSATTVTASNTNANMNGAYNYSFQLQNTSKQCNSGSGSNTTATPEGVQVGTYTTAQISTDNILKVKLTSGAPTTLPCTGYTANYSCLQYTVTVGTRSQTTMVSYGTPPTGSPCDLAKATNSVTLDFGDQVTAGHGPMAVSVSQPQSDNCHANPYAFQLFGSSAVQYVGCAMAPIYANQIASGTLAILTNRQ